MNMLWKYASGALLIALVVALFAGLSFRGRAALSAARADRAEHQVAALDDALKQSEAARAHEHDEALRFQGIANQFEQDKTDAQAKADSTIADLRAGNLRLRDQWATQRLATEAATSAGKPDASAHGCAGVAVDLFRAVDPIVQRQDAQIHGLQAILTAERHP